MTSGLFAQQVVQSLGEGPTPDTVLARQMQALSLAVHIPIVCFGIAFPAMFLFVEGLHCGPATRPTRRSPSAGRRSR